MELYEHQKRILREDPDRALIALGTGGGKTRVCLELARGKTIVVCPKQQKLDRTWEQNAKKFGIIINIKVISKEEFRRDHKTIPECDTLIFDECHTILGVTPDTRQKKGIQIPKVSQLFEAALWYIRNRNPKRLYLASATPVTKPMHLYAIALLLGQSWDYFSFRTKYYFEKMMGMRRIWIPRKDEFTQNKLAEITKKFGYTGQLSDWFDVPEQTHETVHFDLTPLQKNAIREIDISEADPLVKRSKRRTIENGVLYTQTVEITGDKEEKMVNSIKIFPSEKIEYILERAQEFNKILIFAAYTAQIYEIQKALENEGYPVLVLTGAVKNRGEVIERANRADRAIVVAQSSISAGYELPSFPCVIFASKSYRYVDYEQGLGRVLRANALKKNLYLHLVVRGGTDEDCHKSIMSGQDFQEKVME